MTGRRLAAAHVPTRRRLSPLRMALTVLIVGALAAVGVVIGPSTVGPAGATTVAGSPIGAAEHIWFKPGGLRFIGWALDPSTPAPISIFVTVDGKQIGTAVADLARPDVAQAHPSAGPNHGFYTSMLIPEGNHTICVWAKNVGAGANTLMRCDTRTLDYGPIGAAEHIRSRPGAVWVSGWTLDYDQPTAPVTVAIRIDGVSTNVVADGARPDIAAAYPTAGADHGFSRTLPLSQGQHTLCIVAVNIGYGTSNTLRCATFTLDDSPTGHIDLLAQQSGKLRLRGWTYDPDAPTTALTVTAQIDTATPIRIVADRPRPDVAAGHPSAGANHGFDQLLTVAEGSHRVCVTALNISVGRNRELTCHTVIMSFSPTAALYRPMQTATGIAIGGWAVDPDTTAAITVRVTYLGRTTTLLANQAGGDPGHMFHATLPMTSGSHQVCVTGLNVLYGTHDSRPSCQTVNFAYSPVGHYDALARVSGSTSLRVTGWTLDADTTGPLAVAVTMDGAAHGSITASASRPDVAAKYTGFGTAHGIAADLAASDGEHTVCLTAVNVGGGANHSLGCKVVNAVNPVAPSAPRSVIAVAGFGGATVSWAPPASDGGAPWTSYTVTASGGPTVTVAASATTATVTGLSPSTTYTFTVRAVNVAGTSLAGTSPAVRTQAGPPAQTTPAPISTSRYIRNISSGSSTELAMMRSEGVADARANPAGHAYLILLDIGGQDAYDGGVVLSATTHFVPYATLLHDLEAYADGYHSAQQASAPITIAIGTNNDMDVTYASGQTWANSVVDPLAAYAAKYSGMTIAGANDIEPGFRATYTATRSWLSGYLGATAAPFVFNGSADGCAWTVINHSCNNGWTMAGLYTLAAGAAPVRTLNLPQIYNYTMADQWKYISLTGLALSHPRINFGGTLTEYTACAQTKSCGSLTGNSAWSRMWTDLQSDARLKVASLPYSTDLRIN